MAVTNGVLSIVPKILQIKIRLTVTILIISEWRKITAFTLDY